MTIYVLGYDPGAVHRWAALLKFDGKNKPRAVRVWEVPESRDGVNAILMGARSTVGQGCIIAVETPIGVAHGKKLAGVKGKGANLVETRAAAERFASLAYALGFKVYEHSAGEVRQLVCLDKSAKDSVVRAAVESNIVIPADTNVHARDAMAVALFVGAKLSGYRIQYAATGKAKMKSRARIAKLKATRGKPKLPASVLQRMNEQGYA